MFYITTPIYYVNDKPHIGHAYTTILADVLARYHRLMGDDVYFLTGTDEHGQKVAQAAEAKGVSCQEHCDQTVVHFQELWKRLGITHNDFVRTTEERHKRIVSEILQRLFDEGQIYQGEYEGWYCVPDERYFTERDLDDGNCPECGRPVERLAETAYYFRMSEHQQWLIDTIEQNPGFIQPDFRRNETLGFLRQPLGDLCISRPKSRLTWGIELPFDPEYVCYVWFDALVNYISVPGYGTDNEGFQSIWPARYHLIGKDILTTHTVYWPIMLKAMGVELPQTIFAHGWWLMGKDKMGKSIGNVVDPMKLCDQYGVDAFRYFLMAAMTPGQDSSFTEELFIERYNTDLAGGLGNMLSRVIKLIRSHFDSTVPEPGAATDSETELRDAVLAAVAATETAVESILIDRAIDGVMGGVRACNRYFETTEPWKLAKSGQTERLATVLYTAADALRILGGLLRPIIPAKIDALDAALGISDRAQGDSLAALSDWGGLRPGTTVTATKGLFPRIDVKAAKATTDAKPSSAEKSLVNVVETIDLEHFGKVKLKTARVTAAERVEGTDRLLRLELDLAGEARQIVAGIGAVYEPETLVGKMIVVVSNLEPATIRGVRSEGMLLAAKDGKTLRLVTVDDECASGAAVG